MGKYDDSPTSPLSYSKIKGVGKWLQSKMKSRREAHSPVPPQAGSSECCLYRPFLQVTQSSPTLTVILEKGLMPSNYPDNAANSKLIREITYSLEQQSQAWETPASNCSHALAH